MRNSRRPTTRLTLGARARVVPTIDFAGISREVGETSAISRILEKKQERFRISSEYRSKLPSAKSNQSGGVLYTHQSANVSDFHLPLTLV